MKQWNGEGLPPVGAIFEYGIHRSIAKCIAVSHLHVFASKGNPDDEESEYEEFMIPVCSEFRPVQTEREKAIDEIASMIGRGTFFEDAERIYDAGYRKYSAKPGFEWRYVCSTCGCRVEPGKELPHGC